MRRISSIILVIFVHGISAQTTTEEPVRIQCHQCTGSINTECSYYQSYNKSTRCEIESIGCYISVQDGVVRRGCRGDGYCDSNECELCDLWNCNTASRSTMFCNECNSLPGYSNYNENCKDNPEELTPVTCAYDYFTIEETGCYSLRLNDPNSNGEPLHYVRRGCINKLLREPACLDDNDDSCILCQGDGCNIHDVGSSDKIYPTVAILILSLLPLTYKLYQ